MYSCFHFLSGLVRAIDQVQQRYYVTTPLSLSPELLDRVNVLAIGHTDSLPHTDHNTVKLSGERLHIMIYYYDNIQYYGRKILSGTKIHSCNNNIIYVTWTWRCRLPRWGVPIPSLASYLLRINSLFLCIFFIFILLIIIFYIIICKYHHRNHHVHKTLYCNEKLPHTNCIYW